MTADDDIPADPAKPEETVEETSVQRALRLKNAKLDGRPQAPRGGRFQREHNARIAAGKSRPWMSK
ncbi:MAG: hypothetical protein ACK4MH_13355 [Brevundimonas sp.]|uniref:hypothetical protein n=1 Tax=Brevundimonas sp. TaxID=1871086 RepID=UPI003919D414